MSIRGAMLIPLTISSLLIPLGAFAKDNLPIQITGKLQKLVTPDPQMPEEFIALQTKEGQLYFLSGGLVNRLRELLEKVEALKEEETTLIGLIHPKAKITYKRKSYPVFHVEDYVLPQIKGIDLGEEELIKLKLKGEKLPIPLKE